MGMNFRALIIEDNREMACSLNTLLKTEDFEAEIVTSGLEAQRAFSSNPPDVILLDLGLPDMDGMKVLTNLRMWSSIPVVVISGRLNVEQKVAALDAGADDYLVKPFDFGELLARIRCVTRRPPLVHENDILTFKDLTLHVTGSRLNGPAGECSLSKKENELFQFFIRNTGQTLTREQLLTKIWGLDADIENGNLDNYIHFLRRRLNAVGSHVTIRTVRGIGYRFCPPEES